MGLVLYRVYASTCQPQYITKTVWTAKVTLFALYTATVMTNGVIE